MFYLLKKSSIIDSVGREDRESLRRYPSARIDAETRAGASQDRLAPVIQSAMFWPESDKPRGLGQSPNSKHNATVFVERCAIWQYLCGILLSWFNIPRVTFAWLTYPGL